MNAGLLMPRPASELDGDGPTYVNSLLHGQRLQDACRRRSNWFLARHDCGFQDGGCRILAAALCRAFPDQLEARALFRTVDGRMQHIVARPVGDDLFLDSDGVGTAADMERKTTSEDAGRRNRMGAHPIDIALPGAVGIFDEHTVARLAWSLMEELGASFVRELRAEYAVLRYSPDRPGRELPPWSG